MHHPIYVRSSHDEMVVAFGSNHNRQVAAQQYSHLIASSHRPRGQTHVTRFGDEEAARHRSDGRNGSRQSGDWIIEAHESEKRQVAGATRALVAEDLLQLVVQSRAVAAVRQVQGPAHRQRPQLRQAIGVKAPPVCRIGRQCETGHLSPFCGSDRDVEELQEAVEEDKEEFLGLFTPLLGPEGRLLEGGHGDVAEQCLFPWQPCGVGTFDSDWLLAWPFSQRRRTPHLDSMGSGQYPPTPLSCHRLDQTPS